MTISIIPYEQLGSADYGWLKARYHFSFGNYHNPARMGFGALRVINDDMIAPNTGFDPHSHRDMEIITYVRSGAITHKDGNGNQGRTSAGNVQVMSAGAGINHSEYNLEPEPTSLYQIWIIPNKPGVEPRWDSLEFPKDPASNHLPLLVSGRPEDKEKGALFIHADAAIYGGHIKQNSKIVQNLKYNGYLLVSDGNIELEGKSMKKGDGAQIVKSDTLIIQAQEHAELLLIDIPD